MPVLQPLKDRKVIPLWARHVLRIGWVGWWPQLHWHEEAKQAESRDQQRCQGQVHQHLARVKEFRFLLWIVRIFIDRSGRSSLAEKKNVRRHKGENACWNEENMGHEKPRDREGAHLRATPHEALNGLTNYGNFADRVGAYGGGEISSLIPREQVTGEGHCHDQTEQRAP